MHSCCMRGSRSTAKLPMEECRVNTPFPSLKKFALLHIAVPYFFACVGAGNERDMFKSMTQPYICIQRIDYYKVFNFQHATYFFYKKISPLFIINSQIIKNML